MYSALGERIQNLILAPKTPSNSLIRVWQYLWKYQGFGLASGSIAIISPSRTNSCKVKTPIWLSRLIPWMDWDAAIPRRRTWNSTRPLFSRSFSDLLFALPRSQPSLAEHHYSPLIMLQLKDSSAFQGVPVRKWVADRQVTMAAKRCTFNAKRSLVLLWARWYLEGESSESCCRPIHGEAKVKLNEHG